MRKKLDKLHIRSELNNALETLEKIGKVSFDCQIDEETLDKLITLKLRVKANIPINLKGGE